MSNPIRTENWPINPSSGDWLTSTQSPSIDDLTLEAVIPYEKNNAWYSLEYTDDNPFTIDSVVAKIRELGRPFVEFADKYSAHFVIALHENRDGVNTWTVMPAFEDPDLSEQTEPLLSSALQDSWGHVIISHGGSSYKDSEQIGVRDASIPDGSYAFDASLEHGIAVDRATRVRNHVEFSTVAWRDWDGTHINGQDPTTETQVVKLGQISLILPDNQPLAKK